MFVKNKHRRNFILVILGVALLSCIHISFVLHYVRLEIRNYQTRIADMNIQTLKERLHSDTDHLASLASFLSRQKNGFWSTEEAKYIVADFKNHSNFASIGVADVDGMLHIMKRPEPVDISARNYFQFALDGKVSIESIVEVQNGQNVRRLNIGIPVYKEGNVDGVVVGSYAMDKLNHLLPTGLRDKGILSFVVRNDGAIIINGSESECGLNIKDTWTLKHLGMKEEDHQTISDAITNNKKGIITYSVKDKKHYLISVPIVFSDRYARVGAARWNLLIDIPAHYIVKKAFHLLIENMLYAILVLGLFTALSIAFYREKNKEFHRAETNSRTDAVTGGNNRRALEQQFSQAALKKQEMTIFLVDLDNFKQVNDKLGHLAGDEVLIQFSQMLDEIAEKNRGFSGRLGGDEFLLCVPDIKEEYARRLSDEILEEFLSTFSEYCRQNRLGITIGIAHSPEHGNGLYELLKSADEALYVGKRKGKNQATFAGEEFRR